MSTTDDLRIKSLKPLIPPALLLEELPITKKAAEVVTNIRHEASQIVQGKDDRLLVVVGPCSIHDPKGALEYAEKLLPYHKQLADNLCVIMRLYFEKPRTTVGWKGLINDPNLDGSFAINNGLRIGRKLLLDINELGLPAGTEFLDTTIPQFIADLISWGAIGARTTESQIHRELASGLSMPVGFKNGTAGNIQVAIDAVQSARHPHHFLGLTKQGVPAVVSTSGNNTCHIILRGSNSSPNYDENTIAKVNQLLTKANLPQKIMVDCSHGNSQKDHTKQPIVAADIACQIREKNQSICGVMIESNLIEGNQVLTDKNHLKYGQSITDACLNFTDTIKILEQLAEAVIKRR